VPLVPDLRIELSEHMRSVSRSADFGLNGMTVIGEAAAELLHRHLGLKVVRVLRHHASKESTLGLANLRI
jgi:hypothetical protein